jgi:hypothetical protein
MKNYFLSFVLAVLVVLAGVTLRHSVANASQSNLGQNNLVAIGGSPTPPLPHAVAIGGSPTPPLPHEAGIGGSPTPPLPH